MREVFLGCQHPNVGRDVNNLSLSIGCSAFSLVIDLNIWTRTHSTWLGYANSWKLCLQYFDFLCPAWQTLGTLDFQGKKRLFLKCFRRRSKVPYQHRNYWGLFQTINCKCQWVLWYLWKYLMPQRKIMYFAAALKNGSNSPLNFTMKTTFSLCVRSVCNQGKRHRTSPVIAYSIKWANNLWRKNLNYLIFGLLCWKSCRVRKIGCID